jgi:hypothetical protein
MTTKFRASFAKDIKGIKDKKLLDAISKVIEQTEQAKTISEITNVKKLKVLITFIASAWVIIE